MCMYLLSRIFLPNSDRIKGLVNQDKKMLRIKDLFQFSIIVFVGTEFGGQMGVGGSGNWWGQTSWLLRMQLEKLTIFNLQLSEFFYLNFFLWMFNNWTCFSCEIRLKTPRIAAFLTVENSSSDRIKDLVDQDKNCCW